MVLVMLVLGTVAAIAAGGILAALLACLSWTAFTVIRCPEVGPTLAVGTTGILLYNHAGNSTVIQMTLLFGVLLAALAWIEGSDWRAKHPRHR